MFRVPSCAVLIGLTLCTLPSHRTLAQQVSANGVVYEAARNKIGLIRYCSKNALLDPAIADQAVAAMESALRKPPPEDAAASQQGDLAQQAGEDGFWDVGRKRDVKTVAELFHTTPADLCQEWAGETLKAQAPKPSPVTIVVKTVPFDPVPQAAPASGEAGQAARRAAAEKPARVVLRPPLPEKAPFLPPPGAEIGALQHTMPTASHLAAAGDARAEHIMGKDVDVAPSILPQPAAQAAPPEQAAPVKQAAAPTAAPAATAPGPRKAEETIAAQAQAGQPSDEAADGSEKWPFSCLMPGCRWPKPEERRFWRY